MQRMITLNGEIEITKQTEKELIIAINNKSPSPSELNNLLEQYQNGQYGNTEKLALSITERFPEHQFAWKVLGAVIKQTGRISESLLASQKSVELKPLDSEAHNNLSVTLIELGRLDEAEASLRQAIALKPDFAEAYNNLGVTLKELGRLEEAIDSYKKALSIMPEYAEVWNNIFFPLQAIKMHISSPDKFLFDFFNETKSKSEEIAKYILNYKLNRGEGISNSLLTEVIDVISKTKNISIKNPEINKKSSILDHVLPEKIIALMHFGRSGTGLLHSLIDGHTEVSTLPSIYFSEYFDHSTWNKITANGWHGMADCFIATYEVLFDATSTVSIETQGKKTLNKIGYKEGMTTVGNNQDEVLSLDKILFRKELIHLMESQKILDAFIFFKLIHVAYERAIKNHNQKNLIFYHIHNPDAYAQLNFVRSAPNANWIMTVREPIQSLESWLKNPFIDNDYSSCCSRIVTMLLEIDNIIYKTQKSIGVRLEDLKKYPKKTIPALCQWMGIEENESLYEMTAQGKKWWGDPSSPNYSTEGMNPFGKNAINREVGSIFSEDDQFLLRTLFYPFSVHFGYIEPNLEKFKNDLQTTRWMLDKMFDFERTIVERTHADPNTFMKSGSYLYLRSILIDRWNILNKFYTYPNMIECLTIN